MNTTLQSSPSQTKSVVVSPGQCFRVKTHGIVIRRGGHVQLISHVFQDPREAEQHVLFCREWFQGVVGAEVVELPGVLASLDTTAPASLAVEGCR